MTKKQYTDEYLLNYIREKAEELGRTPNLYELKHSYIIKRRFGSYTNAVKIALGKDKIFKYLQEKFNIAKALPAISTIRKDSFEVFSLITEIYGGYREALDNTGFSVINKMYYEKLGKEIRNRRKEKEMTLTSLSEIANIEQSKLMKIEKGNMTNTIKNKGLIQEILAMFDISKDTQSNFLQECYQEYEELKKIQKDHEINFDEAVEIIRKNGEVKVEYKNGKVEYLGKSNLLNGVSFKDLFNAKFYIKH